MRLPMAARKLLWGELLFRFRCEALRVNGARCWILGADLPEDLFAERHAGDESGSRSAALEGGIGSSRECRAKARRYATRNTGEPSAGEQTITRGVGRIVAVHLANIFDAFQRITEIVIFELRGAKIRHRKRFLCIFSRNALVPNDLHYF
jgi:hypothetical protein